MKLGLVRGKYLPAGLHAAEASLSASRAAIVRTVWSCKMPLANTPAILNLLDGPGGADQAYRIVWARFSMMRRYLACRPDEVPRTFRMLDLLAHGAEGHGPVHLLLTSAAEIGFAWDGVNKVGFRLPSLLCGCLSGPVQHFQSAILEASQLKVSARLAERQGFRGAQLLDIRGSLQPLDSSHLRERDKMFLRSILCGGVRNGFQLVKARKEEVSCQFCWKKDGDGHVFWECSFLLYSAG